MAPLALGATGPVGWGVAALGGLVGSQVGKAGLRGATDLLGLTTTESPEAKSIRDAENAAMLNLELNRRTREQDLPLRARELELDRLDQAKRMEAQVALQRQYDYANAVLQMANQSTATNLNSIQNLAAQFAGSPTVFTRG